MVGAIVMTLDPAWLERVEKNPPFPDLLELGGEDRNKELFRDRCPTVSNNYNNGRRNTVEIPGRLSSSTMYYYYHGCIMYSLVATAM